MKNLILWLNNFSQQLLLYMLISIRSYDIRFYSVYGFTFKNSKLCSINSQNAAEPVSQFIFIKNFIKGRRWNLNEIASMYYVFTTFINKFNLKVWPMWSYVIFIFFIFYLKKMKIMANFYKVLHTHQSIGQLNFLGYGYGYGWDTHNRQYTRDNRNIRISDRQYTRDNRNIWVSNRQYTWQPRKFSCSCMQ